MANFKQVNKAIKAEFPNLSLEVVRGDGYVYFVESEWSLPPESLMVHPVSTSTESLIEMCVEQIKEWLPEFNKERNRRFWKDRSDSFHGCVSNPAHGNPVKECKQVSVDPLPNKLGVITKTPEDRSIVVSKTIESLGIPRRYFGFPSSTARCERCGSTTVESCDSLNCGFLGAGNGGPGTEKYIEQKYTKEQHEAIAEIMKNYKDRIDKYGHINTHYEYGGVKRNNGLPVDIVLLNKLCGFDPEVPETITKIE